MAIAFRNGRGQTKSKRSTSDDTAQKKDDKEHTKNAPNKMQFLRAEMRNIQLRPPPHTHTHKSFRETKFPTWRSLKIATTSAWLVAKAPSRTEMDRRKTCRIFFPSLRTDSSTGRRESVGLPLVNITSSLNTVSYTHLTLPTIYSV